MQKEAAHSKFVVADGRNVLLLQLGRVIGAPKGHCIHGSRVEPAVKRFGRSISALRGVVSDLAQGADDRLPAEGGLGGGVSSGRRCGVIGSSGYGLERVLHAHLVEGEAQRLHSTAAAQAVSAVCPAAGMDSSGRTMLGSAYTEKRMPSCVLVMRSSRLSGSDVMPGKS